MSNEQTIRELAYQIWEAEGRPDGQQDRHWSLAHKLSSQVARADTAPPATRVARSRPQAAAAVDSPPPTSTRRGSARRPKKSEQPH
ncbi:MAG TPA: DUF2934 domain-containing protein [Pseudomonas sp.]|nr:DUF2934 domain-containing protein [Pseudomonas sp.]